MGNDQNKKIGKRIHQARKQKKISMKKLGEMVGLHESTISRYEKGEIISLDIEKMKEFARALGVNAAWLMGWEDDSYKDFGKIIYNLRIEKNISIMEMSEELHISVETLKEYEGGKRQIPMHILQKIASYLGVDVEEITSVHIEGEDENLDRVIFSQNQKVLKWYETWDKEVGVVDFSEEEMQKLMEYAKFLISQRKGDNK